MGKNKGKNKNLNLDSSDQVILGLIANLNSPKRVYPTEVETKNALTNIQELVCVLTGKAHRVARCIVDKSFYEDNEKVKSYAQFLMKWADTI